MFKPLTKNDERKLRRTEKYGSKKGYRPVSLLRSSDRCYGIDKEKVFTFLL